MGANVRTGEAAGLERLGELARRALHPVTGFDDGSFTGLPARTIHLYNGNPHPRALPLADYAAAARHVLGDPGRLLRALRYQPTAGVPELRAWIARREGVDVRRIVLTTGAQEGLALAVLAAVPDGADVVVDDPIFPIFLHILALEGGRAVPVPVLRDGLDVEALERLLRGGLRPAALYTVPDFHNPAQATLSADKRRALVGLAQRYGFTVIADNPYRELRFAGRPVSDAVFNQSPNVIHVNTFSKTLGPGLRVGWLVLPEPLAEPVARLRERLDAQSSGVLHYVVFDMLTSEKGWFDALVERNRALYRANARAFLDAFGREAPGLFRFEAPEGGLFLWGEFADPHLDVDAFFHAALAAGVTYQRGEWFGVADPSAFRRRVRVSYSSLEPADFREAARRLAAVRAQIGRRP